MTYILGLQFSSHDSSACLVKDGKLIGFIEEERLNRIKHTNEFPEKAIACLLKEEGITLDDVDYLAVPTTESVPLVLLLKSSLSFGLSGFLPLVALNMRLRFKFWRALKNFERRLKKERTKIILVKHHTSHLANAFLLSPFEEAAILSVDGAGDGFTGKLAFGKGKEIKCLQSIYFPHSLGLLYQFVTKHLGFGTNGDEGKVMGLSSYGRANRCLDVFRDIVQLKDDGAYAINLKYFEAKYTSFPIGDMKLSDYFKKRLGPSRKSKEPITERHEDIAAGLQAITEEAVIHMLKSLFEKTKCENLVLSGGVALNSVMNGKLHRETPFKNIFIQPIAYDAGNSIGAAFHVWNNVLKNPRQYKFSSCYLGPEFSRQEIEKTLKEIKANYEILENPSRRAAELVAQGKIVGWFQGKMEGGARALGNRTILADPRLAEMKDIINREVKHREPFRPFAPAILEEKTKEYFEDDFPVPFMEKVYPIRREKQKLIPAVTHVDGTGRLQTVNKKDNELFYNLISEFFRLSGVPVVLNTSFNIKGEPIVCSPLDAIRCFYSTGMDYLIIDQFLLKK